MEALREIITNSVMHRDYSNVYSQFKVYDDRVEFWNPGSLPYDLSEDQLRETHLSRPRNILISEIFFLANLVEGWGQGTLKVITECKDGGLPEPTFKNT